jgi:uncharacterized protein (TIGR03435 family)
MLSHLTDVSLRSLILLAIAAIAAWIARRRGALALEHAIWTATVCGMLALFVLGSTLPTIHVHVFPAAPPISTSAPAPVITNPQVHIATPFTAPAPARSFDALPWTYSTIVFLLLARFAAGIWLAHRLMSRAREAECGAWESDRIAVPVTLGLWNPRVVLPVDWRTWPREKLDAVLAHEQAHARRRDGLVSAFACVNRCIFWFHPAAWLIERRLAALAEHLCDEHGASALGDATAYARILLEMAQSVGRHGRLRGHALTMASRSHIGQRVEALLKHDWAGRRPAPRLAVALATLPLVIATAAVQLDQQTAPASSSTPAGKFDVVSVRPCTDEGGGGKSSGGRGGSGSPRGIGTTPGRLNVTCMTVSAMIRRAYTPAPGGPAIWVGDQQAVRGGPAWIYSDRYTIRAETDGAILPGMMTGPMLQALLEDRFHLRLRHDQEEIAIYTLTVAKGGTKLKPIEPGSCRVPEAGRGMTVEEMKDPAQKPMCGNHVAAHGPNWTMEAGGTTMAQFAGALGGMIMDRPVADRTGLAGQYAMQVEFAHDQATAGLDGLNWPESTIDAPLGPTVFTELERKLGLRLTAARGPRAYLTIDGVERPAEN